MAAGPASGGDGRVVHSVSEISRRIKELVEPRFPDVWVEGEVSNVRASAAGHLYFTLKDDRAQLPAVCFRSAAVYLRFKPKNGESFRARGRVSVYEGRGQYQIIVEVLEPAGRGTLHEEFERLKEKLSREGLFAAERKRKLPPYPSRIGVVTSARGAALRDILSVLERRHDAIDVLIHPADVQGQGAGAQIARGLGEMGGRDVDLVIVTRGGGSIEDLWPFNEEVVARAIAACPKPVVSAVGHETDFTISDFVADVRAPTPSAAAEMVARSKRELADRLHAGEQRMAAAFRYRLSRLRQFLTARAGHRGFAIVEGRLKQRAQQVDDCVFRMDRVVRSGQWVGERRRRVDDATVRARTSVTAMTVEGRRGLASAVDAMRRAGELKVVRARQRLAALEETLQALSPLGVLARGFAVCRTAEGRVVRSAQEAPAGADVTILLHEGRLEARVTKSGAVEGASREGDDG